MIVNCRFIRYTIVYSEELPTLLKFDIVHIQDGMTLYFFRIYKKMEWFYMLQKVENYRHALDQLEKSIISYSFIEFLSQTQKAAKPFCNDLAAFIWSYWPDLNRRPADYESAALPTEPQ